MKAMESSITSQIKGYIMDMIGNGDTDECFNKIHAVLELADNLKIKDNDIVIKIKDLQRKKKEFEKAMEDELEDD